MPGTTWNTPSKWPSVSWASSRSSTLKVSWRPPGGQGTRRRVVVLGKPWAQCGPGGRTRALFCLLFSSRLAPMPPLPAQEPL